ncbi:hypothetical protein GALL_503030 [mine drainage metagenome]|uniref:Uncharacterized protein n=1 Tax=mine drainage metagenome TaxID=410659 RepID=A0A1J5PKK9_9ZZZZ
MNSLPRTIYTPVGKNVHLEFVIIKIDKVVVLIFTINVVFIIPVVIVDNKTITQGIAFVCYSNTIGYIIRHNNIAFLFNYWRQFNYHARTLLKCLYACTG